MLLQNIDSPDALRNLPETELPALAGEIRETILHSVARNGGHLASSLGAVELIIALHRVFSSPSEPLFFDVGHQAYAHKLLTGRREAFDSLRAAGGISGFPHPGESVHDPAFAGHAGTALSLAMGFAAADPDASGRVIAVVGDASAGCGVTFEAFNNAAESPGRKRLIIILNDNQMSISRNVGALKRHLNKLLLGKRYNRFRARFKNLLLPRPRLIRFFRRLNDLLKGALLPPGIFFEALGIRYLGPANGHDLNGLIRTLERVRTLDGPVLLHVVTEKGHGCEFARKDPTKYHGISGCSLPDGTLPRRTPGFSEAFSHAMLKIAEEDPRLIAVSAAMLEGTGLRPFSSRFPRRSIDVGIAEEHALTFACGAAAAGKHPVVAIYDTFLQRALDAVCHDAALASLPIVIAADRAGAVEDGPTHHGIYNCGFLRALPGVTLMAPACCAEMEDALRFALSLSSPVVIRYPRGTGADLPSAGPFLLGKAAVRRNGDPRAPVLWSFGAEAGTALDTAEILRQKGISCFVIDARFLSPFDRETALLFAAHPHYTIEDHVLSGGLFSALSEALANVPHGPITPFAWPDGTPLGHGKISALRTQHSLTPDAISERVERDCSERVERDERAERISRA